MLGVRNSLQRVIRKVDSKKSHGIYTILSGTGIYANATGTGSFDSVPTKFKDAIKFDVKTP